MPAEKISLQNAKEDRLFYVVANVVVYRASDGRCLILQRGPQEKVHAGKYCLPGGKLEWADLDIGRPSRLNGEVLDFTDAMEKLLAREVGEEAGIEIEPQLLYVNSVSFVRPDEIPVILIKFAARYKSGEVRKEQGVFTAYAWVNEEEAKEYDCIEGIPEEISTAITYFAKNPR